MRKQGQTTFFLAWLVLGASAFAASGHGGKAHFGPAQNSGTTAAAGASGRAGSGSTRGRIDPRNPPPLDPTRKVNEVDCSKPIDLSAGNLRCK